MKPYGLPRIPAVEFPDNYDCRKFGRASHIGNTSGKSGDFHPLSRPNNKRKARRIWKGKERSRSKKELRKELEKWKFYFEEDYYEDVERFQSNGFGKFPNNRNAMERLL